MKILSPITENQDIVDKKYLADNMYQRDEAFWYSFAGLKSLDGVAFISGQSTVSVPGMVGSLLGMPPDNISSMLMPYAETLYVPLDNYIDASLSHYLLIKIPGVGSIKFYLVLDNDHYTSNAVDLISDFFGCRLLVYKENNETIINKMYDVLSKQDQLVSGTNIKTINNESILGSGNISISGGGTVEDVQVDGTSVVSNGVANVELADYVKNTDYATSSKGGVFKTSPTYATSISSGILRCLTKTYSDYSSSNNYLFISKGTLENVLARTRQDWATANVKDYGAVGDGTTDDSTSIQNAIDAVKTNGGIVYFPVGTYNVASTIWYYSNMVLYFEKGATLLRGSSSLRYLLANDISSSITGYNGTHDVKIIGATFDGNSSYSTTSTDDNKTTLMNTGHAKNIVLQDCTFKNGNVWHFYEVCGSENVKIINSIFDGSNYGGTTSTQDSYSELLQLDNDVIISGSYSYGATKNGTSGDLTPCKNIEIDKCKFICNGYANAIGNHNPQSNNHTYIRIHDCYFEGNGGTGGYIDFDTSTVKVDIYDNTFIGNTSASTNVGLRIQATSPITTVSNNRFDGYGQTSNAYTGSIVAFGNTIDGSIDATSSSSAFEFITASNMFSILTPTSTYGTVTIDSTNSRIFKHNGRITGELKLTGVTTNSSKSILLSIKKSAYKPNNITVGVTSEASGNVPGCGYLVGSNSSSSTMRITYSAALSSKSASVWFDYECV